MRSKFAMSSVTREQREYGKSAEIDEETSNTRTILALLSEGASEDERPKEALLFIVAAPMAGSMPSRICSSGAPKSSNMGVSCHTPIDWSAEVVINTLDVFSGCQVTDRTAPKCPTAWLVTTPPLLPPLPFCF